MTTTTAVSERFMLVAQPVNAGALTTIDGGPTARGLQLHQRLQTLHHELLPPNSGFSGTNTAALCIAGGGLSAWLGSGMAILGGILLASEGSWDGFKVAGGFWSITALCGAAYALGSRSYSKTLARKAGDEAPHVADLSHAFEKLSDLERSVVAYRSHALLSQLDVRGAKSRDLHRALEPMTQAFKALKHGEQGHAQHLAALVDAIVLPTGAVAPDLRKETELLTRQIENLPTEERAFVASLVRDQVQIALDVGDGHRWRLRRLLEVLDGKRIPYATEETSEIAGAPLVTVPDNGVTFERCITLLKGGLAAERADSPLACAQTKIIPSMDPTLAERVAAHFERDGYHASIFDNGGRLVVTVFKPSHPPSGAFVRGERSER